MVRIVRNPILRRFALVAVSASLVVLLLPLVWGRPVFSQVPIASLYNSYSVSGDVPGDQAKPAIASSGSGFLAAWTDPRVHPNGDVYARRIAADGSGPVGDTLILAEGVYVQQDVDLAYNAATSAYVAVWEDRRNDGYPTVYGQLIHQTGDPIGGNFEVTGDPFFKTEPAVACNASHNECLVVWKYPGPEFDILARRISGWGGAVGGVVTACDAAGDQSEPDVAYSPDADAYLVVWQDNRAGDTGRIYGQRIGHDGAILGPDIWVSLGDSGDASHPAVAYNREAGQYLVVWESFPLGTVRGIYGQRVGVDGNLVGNVIYISNDESSGPGGVFPNPGADPDVVCAPSPGKWMVAWLSYGPFPHGADTIEGQFVSGAGELTDEWAYFGQEIAAYGWLRGQTAVAYSAVQRTFVAVWVSGGQGTDDVYGGSRQLPPPTYWLPLTLKESP